MAWGGKRDGAGRPKGRGKYGEPTKTVRIPVTLENEVHAYIESKGHKLPFFSTKVQAGFPSPADDFLEEKMSVQELLVKHPESTFFVRVTGDSMRDAQIVEGDILVVDRSLRPKAQHIVIAVINGELTVKRLIKTEGVYCLKPENPNFPLITLDKEADVTIWGVVTSVIRQLKL